MKMFNAKNKFWSVSCWTFRGWHENERLFWTVKYVEIYYSHSYNKNRLGSFGGDKAFMEKRKMKEKDRVRHVTQLTHTNVPTPKERQYLSIHLKKFFIFTPGFPISPKLLCFQLLFWLFLTSIFTKKRFLCIFKLLWKFFLSFYSKVKKNKNLNLYFMFLLMKIILGEWTKNIKILMRSDNISCGISLCLSVYLSFSLKAAAAMYGQWGVEL